MSNVNENPFSPWGYDESGTRFINPMVEKKTFSEKKETVVIEGSDQEITETLTTGKMMVFDFSKATGSNTLTVNFEQKTSKSEGYVNEFVFRVITPVSDSDSDKVSLSLPDDVVFSNDEEPAVENNTVTEISVIDNYACFAVFANEAGSGSGSGSGNGE